jgi:hypothetical protein
VIGDFPGVVRIEEGRLSGDQLQLKVSITSDGEKVLYSLSGTLAGNEIKGVLEGIVEGQQVKLNWSARRAQT